jgi:predicted TIM-barrel fold metal-dependent hydrolase
LPEQDRQKVFETNARRVYPRVKEHLQRREQKR